MKGYIVFAILMLFLTAPFRSDAQRRGRPGAMKHTETEVRNKQEELRRKKEGIKIKCKYICDGHIFEGPVYVVGTLGGVQAGDAAIIFKNGKFKLSFDAAKFKIKKYPLYTEKERAQRGISDYEYEHSWEYKKLGEDFEYGGKYATIEQENRKWLMLYNGDTDTVYAKIPIKDVNDNSFELEEDGMLVRMTCVR